MALIKKITLSNTTYDLGADANNIAYNSNDSVKDKIDGYDEVMPSSASSSNKLATANDIPDVSNFITKAVNDLTYYYTSSNTYTKTEVDNLITAAKNGRFIVVVSLPTTDIDTKAIYLLPKQTTQTNNVYDEYINTDGTTTGWEKIGDTQIDLSNYVQKSSTSGLIKNDGTIDTNTYALSSALSDYIAKSQTSGLVKNDGTIDTNTYAQTSALSDYIAKSQTSGLMKNDGTVDTNTYATASQLPSIATDSVVGLVKPDGTSITVDANGTISSSGASLNYNDATNKPQVNGVTLVGDKSGSDLGLISIIPSGGLSGEVVAKVWTGLTNFYGQYIWTDGDNIYYSIGSSQYVLDKSTSTWSAKTWTGLTSFYGDYIWTDGDNIYYSYNSTNYVLDKSTSTWNTKTWNGLTNFRGDYIWTDGTNIYYSNSSTQYVLDKSTSTWSEKTWTGLTNFTGKYVWSDGDNIYYSNGGSSSQYVLDKATSTWSQKTWTGLTSFYGDRIWTDGDNIYYSNGGSSSQYVLDKSTSTWSTKTWTGGYASINGSYIWTDGTNIYYSYDGDNYEFKINEANLLKSDGTIDTNTYLTSVPTATSSALGLVKPDNTTITVDANGVLTSTATGSAMSKTHYTITASSWSNSVDVNGYYTYTITLNPELSLSWPPSTDIAGVNDSTFSTDAEKEAYDLLDECNLTDTDTLVLYAKTKPETTFYIWVEGEVAS